MEAAIIIPIAIVAAVVIRLIAGSMNHNRIRDYTRGRGGRVTGIEWNPFGPGWFGEKDSAIYRVHYVDQQGRQHEAHCKTSLFSGVYFTRDFVVGQAPQMVDETSPPNEANSELERLTGQLAHDPRAESSRETEAAFERLLNRESRDPQPETPRSPEAVSAELEQLASQAARDPKTKSLEEENRRLRQELEELKRKQSNDNNSFYNRGPR